MKITKQQLKDIIREELDSAISEIDYEKIKVPSTLKRFMDKFTTALKDAELPRQKEIAVLYSVIKSLGIDEKELVAYVTKLKQAM